MVAHESGSKFETLGECNIHRFPLRIQEIQYEYDYRGDHSKANAAAYEAEVLRLFPNAARIIPGSRLVRNGVVYFRFYVCDMCCSAREKWVESVENSSRVISHPIDREGGNEVSSGQLHALCDNPIPNGLLDELHIPAIVRLGDSAKHDGAESSAFKAIRWVLGLIFVAAAGSWGVYLDQEIGVSRSFSKRSLGEITRNIKDLETDSPSNIDIITVENGLWTGDVLQTVARRQFRAGSGSGNDYAPKSTPVPAPANGSTEDRYYFPIVSAEKLSVIPEYKRLMNLTNSNYKVFQGSTFKKMSDKEIDNTREQLVLLKPTATIRVFASVNLAPQCAQNRSCIEERLTQIKGKVIGGALPSFERNFVYGEPTISISPEPIIVDLDDLSRARPPNWVSVVVYSLIPMGILVFSILWGFKGNEWLR